MIAFRDSFGRLHWGAAPVGALRGLGFDYYDILAQAGIEQCGPLDDACNAHNEAAATAARNLWDTQYQQNPATATAPVPQVSFNVDTKGFLNQPPGSDGTGYTTVNVNGQSISDTTLRQADNQQLAQTISQQIAAGAPSNAATAAILSAPGVTVKAPAPVVVKKTAAAPAAGAGPNILGLQVEGSPEFTIPGTSIDVPALPWWALAGGAAVLAFVVMKGKR